MDTGISLQGFIPVRKDPFERSEMVTQILFGEYVVIDDDEGKWLHIRAELDKYEGWIDKKCIHPVSSIKPHEYIVCLENMRLHDITRNHPVILPLGSSIPEVTDGAFELAGKKFSLDHMKGLVRPGEITVEELFPELLSIPYLWGGRSGFGFDCSGLTQFLCRIAGKEIPRDASEQSAIGQTLSFMKEAQTGDLAFFDNPEGMIHHVGMMIGNDRIIHASGMVRIDRIDQQGIFNKELGQYTYKLRVIKRILN